MAVVLRIEIRPLEKNYTRLELRAILILNCLYLQLRVTYLTFRIPELFPFVIRAHNIRRL